MEVLGNFQLLAEEEREVDVVGGRGRDLVWKFLPGLVEAPHKANLEVQEILEAAPQVGQDRNRGLASFLPHAEQSIGGLNFFLWKINEW